MKKIIPRLDQIFTYSLLFFTVVFLFEYLRMSLWGRLMLDETAYMHQGWLLSIGQIPFKDFHHYHFVVCTFLLSIPFTLLGDSLTAISLSRLLVYGFILLMCLSVWVIEQKKNRVRALLPVIFILSISFFSTAIQTRPDIFAFTFFMGALALLYCDFIDPKKRGFFAGLLFALGCATIIKVPFYGLAFIIALIFDLRRGNKSKTFLLGHPFAFLGGLLLVSVVMFGYFVATKSFGAWLESLAWYPKYTNNYPGFSWTVIVNPLIRDYQLLSVMFLIGYFKTIANQVKNQSWFHHPDSILTATVPFLLITLGMNVAPYDYNLIPLIGLMGIFAARGFFVIYDWVRDNVGQRSDMKKAAPFIFVISLFFIMASAEAFRQHAHLSNPSNRQTNQIKSLKLIKKLTTVDDVIYDNSAFYIFRPHAYYFHTTTQMERYVFSKTLAKEAKAAILENEAVVFIKDVRSRKLPKSLRSFLKKNYVPYNNLVRVWGKEYPRRAKTKLNSSFNAIRDDKYFVHPKKTLKNGVLKIGGVKIKKPIFTLTKGKHSVSFEGSKKGFSIIWLPANGKRFKPYVKKSRR